MMAFPQFSTERLFIRHLQPADAQGVVDYYWHNREHLEPWEPAKDAAFYDVDATRERITTMQHNFVHDRAVHFVAFTPDRHRQDIVGVCNFTGILRGVFQGCYLGFSIAAQHQGKGLMQALLTPCIHYMFAEKCLHRIMANHLPHNTRSARLLHTLGFAREGYAKSYLKIAGEWQDHVLRAKVNPQA